MNFGCKSYTRDPRLRFRDAELTTLASKDLKRADMSLKHFLSHELQTRVLYARLAFKASKCRVQHAHFWRTQGSKIYKLVFHQLMRRSHFQSMNAWISIWLSKLQERSFRNFKKTSRDRAWMHGSQVSCLNFKKEVFRIFRKRSRDRVSSWSAMTEPQRNRALLWQRPFSTWRRVLWREDIIRQDTTMKAPEGMLFYFEIT